MKNRSTDFKQQALNRFILGVFFVYGLSLITSIAVMEITTTLLILSALIHSIFVDENRTYRHLCHPLTGFAFLWLAIVIAGALINNPHHAPFIQFLGFMKWIPVFLSLLYWYLQIPRDLLKPAGMVLIGASILVSIYAIAQAFTGIDLIREKSQVHPVNEEVGVWRGAGFFSNPLTFAYSYGMLFHVYISFLIYETFLKKKWVLWRWAAGIFGLLAFFSTLSRGAFIATGMSISFTLLFFLKKLPWKVSVGIVGSILLTIGVVFYIYPPFYYRALSIFQYTGSLNDRLILWQANWELFKDYPWIGVGFNENENMMPHYLEKIGHPEAFKGHAHSNYFQILASTGALGFLSFAGFSITALYYSFRSYEINRDSEILKSLLFGCFLAQIFFHMGGLSECNFIDTEVNHVLMSIIAFSLACYIEKKRPANA